MPNSQIKKWGYLPKNNALIVILTTIICLFCIIVAYFSFTPVLGGLGDLDLPYSILTHTISKLGRLENQPNGMWVLWSIAMMGFGFSLIIIIKNFYQFMNQFNPKKKNRGTQHIFRLLAWICFLLGSFAVIILGFFPLSNSNGIYTEQIHRFIVNFLAFLVLGWLFILKDMIGLLKNLKRSFLPFLIQYLLGSIVIGLTIYWVIDIPSGGFYGEEIYLIWGFWSYVLAEWLAMILIIVYFIQIFILMITHREKTTPQ